MKVYTYTVEGIGNFPHDMLRYDAAWPLDSDSALSLGLNEWIKRRQVNLASTRQPTPGRWRSFGWILLSPVKMGNYPQ